MADLGLVKAALSKGVDVLEKAGMLDSLAQKLINHPDTAASKLTEVLNNIAKTYEGLENAFIELKSLSFKDAEGCSSALRSLEKMSGAQLGTRMMESRASCSMIGTIYFRYLGAC